MRLVKALLPDNSVRVGQWLDDDRVHLLDLSQVDGIQSLADVLFAPDPHGLARYLLSQKEAAIPVADLKLLAPIDQQEVWAAGVTYKRSQVARMAESESAASHYDKVYTAPRPEIFFKGTASRVSGPDQPLRVRWDSRWSVPEPEFALVIAPDLRLVGYTIGNDMSARDIEGENPLYLPQAKVYNQCCGLGPAVLVPRSPLAREALSIRLEIQRKGQLVFHGETSATQMAREFKELISWLGRENDLPTGAFLLTGTGVVPPDTFTLEDGDRVSITVPGIGTLQNPIVKSAPPSGNR